MPHKKEGCNGKQNQVNAPFGMINTKKLFNNNFPDKILNIVNNVKPFGFCSHSIGWHTAKNIRHPERITVSLLFCIFFCCFNLNYIAGLKCFSAKIKRVKKK